MRNSVVIDTVRGLAFIGAVSIAVREAGKRGEIQVGGSSGPVLRPITFGERSRVVTRAAASPVALDIVCAGVLQAATVQSGHVDRSVQEILALTLAGADQEAPGFAEAVLLVAQAARWELSQLYEAEAAEIDRLAIALAGHSSDSGWTRVVFARSGETLESLRRELGEQLLQRGDPIVSATTLERTPVAMPMSPPTQAPSRFGGEHARFSEEPTSPPFAGTPTTPTQRDLPVPPESAEPSLTGKPITNVSAARPPYVRIRIPESRSEKSAARRSAHGASAHDRRTDRPLLRWSLLPDSGARVQAVPEAPVRRGDAPLAPSASAATASVGTLVPRSDALLRARRRVSDEIPAAPRDSTEVRQPAAGEIRRAPDSSAALSAGVQSVMHALENRAPIEQPATLATMQPLFSDWSEAADALAALLEHEADLRGID